MVQVTKQLCVCVCVCECVHRDAIGLFVIYDILRFTSADTQGSSTSYHEKS